MTKIYIDRKMWVRGAILGRLIWDGEKVCDTLERMDGCLPKGTYEIKLEKCGKPKRMMPILYGGDASPSCATSLSLKNPCGMMQPGNGAFTLPFGGIIIGEGHEPGYVIQSQQHFLLLFGRLKKNLQRGKRVWVEIR